MHLLSRFGDFSLSGWQVIVRTSSKSGKIRLSSSIWPWSSRSITPQNNKHLYQGVLHLCFKFGDSILNGWRVIVRTSKWFIHTRTHFNRYTDIGDDNTQRPKLASSKNVWYRNIWMSGMLTDIVAILLSTLNMMNCFKDYKGCIYTSYLILWRLQKPGISKHGIDQISWNIPSLA